MPGTRLAIKATNPSIHVTSGTVADAIDAQRRLTDRDHTLITLLAAHQVLTTEQITRLAFTADTTARHRLTLLATRGVLARFRRCQRPGSQSWRYTLGVLGAMMHAASSGKPIPRPSRVADHILALAQSPRLDHLLGINDFFTHLAHVARQRKHCALSQWWPERKIGATVGKIVRPDGYGEWTEHHRTLAFFLEYDNGTEQLERLATKLDSYQQLAQAGITKPILFVLPTTARHNHFHTMLRRHPHRIRGLTVASVAADQHDPEHTSPADQVWLPATANHRLRLIDLPTPPTTHPTAPPPTWPDDEPTAA